MPRGIPAPFLLMDQQFAHRDLVIKVKYGDTLRRISASVDGNRMDHNIDKLRAKITDFFKFSNDADLILSYIDEDGDTVTLDNDDELLDAVIGQRLNPLRINVQLKSLQSDTVPTSNEPLKYIPEPFINALANLLNISQNIVSSSPPIEVAKSEPFKSAMESLSKDVKDKDGASCNYDECVSAAFSASSTASLGTPNSYSFWAPGRTFSNYMDMNPPQNEARAPFPSQAGFIYDPHFPFARQVGLPGSLGAPPMHALRPIKPLNDCHYSLCGGRQGRGILGSCFIDDVTVLDGTVMAPMVYFTKIWRMGNNGRVAWPFGTQLVWVGGDKFGDRLSVDLEIPESGFAVDKELDVAVDFIAPSRVGCYFSYWRMASPSGQRFGQRVWVVIEVRCSQPNYSPGNRDGSVIIDVNAEPFETGLPVIMVAPEVVHVPRQLMEPHPAHKVVGDLLDEASMEEETLLKELEEMGFMQIDLNKEIIRRNEYDLESSVLELCDVSEWDPLPYEMKDMGYSRDSLTRAEEEAADEERRKH